MTRIVENRFLARSKNRKRIGVACKKHGFVLGEVCAACKKEKSKVPQTAAIHIFKPMYAEHLENEPVYIRSKKHYKDECKKRNVRCVGLS